MIEEKEKMIEEKGKEEKESPKKPGTRRKRTAQGKKEAVKKEADQKEAEKREADQKEAEKGKKEEERPLEEGPELSEIFSELDSLLERLEGEESLEKSFSLYERGVRLIREAAGSIDRIEKEVKVLDEDGILP